jgi:putative ABC transport system permease protein
MISLSKGSISSAYRTIRTNRARSLMTMTGIVIGVVAALVVVGIGQGIQRQVAGQISRLGKDVITVRPGAVNQHDLLTALGSSSTTQPLSGRDVRAIQVVEHVASVTPLTQIDGSVSAGGSGTFDGTVIGTTGDFAQVLHQEIAFGSFFSDDRTDEAPMAVVGENVAASLFEEGVPLGRAMTFRGQDFVVVGILKPFQSTPLLGQADFNNAIFIPYETAQQLTNNSAPVYQILVQPDDSANVDTVVRGVNSALLKVHGGQQSFSVLKQGQSLSVANGVLDLLSNLVLAAAATSLLVGGIGVMNIMWVSVTERMREIGIRKAVGGTNRQILGQFLTEAILLAVGGWFIGALVSLAFIGLLRLFSSLEPVIPWVMLGVSFIVTTLTGVLFGSIPALKAAAKDPIDALRNE